MCLQYSSQVSWCHSSKSSWFFIVKGETVVKRFFSHLMLSTWNSDLWPLARLDISAWAFAIADSNNCDEGNTLVVSENLLIKSSNNAMLASFLSKKAPKKSGLKWRRKRDSNPRAFWANGFQDRLVVTASIFLHIYGVVYYTIYMQSDFEVARETRFTNPLRIPHEDASSSLVSSKWGYPRQR